MATLGSEFSDPRNPAPPPVLDGRRIFLDRVARVAPKALTSLRDDVLPAFGDWAAGSREPGELLTVLSWWANGALPALLLLPEKTPPELRVLRDSRELRALMDRLAAWAQHWHLTDDWLLVDTRNTLLTWHQWPKDKPTPLRFFGRTWGGAVPETVIDVREPGKPVFEAPMRPCPPFEPTLETEDRYKERVGVWVQVNLAAAAYTAKKYGLARSPVRRARSGKTDPGLHFEWLARYQCLEQPYTAIKGADLSNVRKAVKKTAQEIGITLRRSARKPRRK